MMITSGALGPFYIPTKVLQLWRVRQGADFSRRYLRVVLQARPYEVVDRGHCFHTRVASTANHEREKRLADSGILLPTSVLQSVQDTISDCGGVPNALEIYDFFLLDGDRLGLAIRDVSGKGIPAALFMAVPA